MAAAAKDFGEEDTRPIKLLFQDEGRFARISDPAHCWAPKGVRPIVPAHIVREYTHVFSAVCPHDGQSCSLILPYADTGAMKMFLTECSEHSHHLPAGILTGTESCRTSLGIHTGKLPEKLYMAHNGGIRKNLRRYSEDHYGMCLNDPKHCGVPLGHYLINDGEVV